MSTADPRVIWLGRVHPTGGYDRAYRTQWAEQYMLGDVLHRTDGPARVWCDGSVEYWRHGVRHAADPGRGQGREQVAALRAALERRERALVVRQQEVQRELAAVRARIAGLPR